MQSGYDWASGRYPTWTESVWKGFSLRSFLQVTSAVLNRAANDYSAMFYNHGEGFDCFPGYLGTSYKKKSTSRRF